MVMDASKEPKIIVKSPMSFGRRKWTKMDKTNACILLFLHVLCIFAPFQFNWSAFWIAFALYIITGLFGITISYHRNLSHRSFKLPKWLEYLFAYCGVQSLQGDPIYWVSTHRYHHQFVDTEKDPHSPIQGFWFSYIFWIFDSNTLTNKMSNFQERPDRSTSVMIMKHNRLDNVGDLKKQTFYTFIHNTYILHPIALAVILYAGGGIPFLIWGMCVRSVMLLHATYLVNSICHLWGKQPWKTGDLSRNNWLINLIAFGEGWHNNHHAFEYSARMGFEWWQFDPGWYVVIFLQAIGLATQVKLPSQSHKQKLSLINTLRTFRIIFPDFTDWLLAYRYA
ncbi:palmitoyl-monogalactosyldiacylglycerol delta-7 desaturase, chloroplastic-like [Momordica charantia]|uniref:Palmitoyl-monogalactosyldiacylglycerol delta-7 desaturase, chloroplastic-like n=1 Tax=Momordica charantia TaxID=3673 RepID=A0A6J1DIY2_MOMCH|nr:palmitoyl-monogalactosyldiacylglycerol delta-7 desaturase, chloroplastic-like [Momordica charantia]